MGLMIILYNLFIFYLNQTYIIFNNHTKIFRSEIMYMIIHVYIILFQGPHVLVLVVQRYHKRSQGLNLVSNMQVKYSVHYPILGPRICLYVYRCVSLCMYVGGCCVVVGIKIGHKCIEVSALINALSSQHLHF